MPTVAEAAAREAPAACAPDPRRLTASELARRIEARATSPDPGRSCVLVARLDPRARGLALASPEARRHLLSELERRVSGMLRAGDRYAFVSREEIWLLLPDLATEALAGLAAHALRERLRRPIERPSGQTGDLHRPMQPEVGGAWIPGASRASVTELLNLASQAASQADEPDAPVRIVEASAGASASGQVSDAQAASVRLALEANALELVFQPKVDLRTGRCQDAEALVRWPRDMPGPAVDPATIVAACEQRGMTRALTQFTLNAALRQTAAWRDLGLDVAVALNLSAATLVDPTLPLAVDQALSTWGLPAGRLTLELTESALIEDEGTAGEVMHALDALGCRLSIDDFGTGYSPFTYLRRFPLHELKMDRSFVAQVLREPRDRAIVAALTELGHAFGMKVVAEGIEDGRTADYLSTLGCDLGQGWHFARAMEADAFAAWCRARNQAAADTG